MQSCRQLFNQDLPLGLRNWLKILLLWVLKPTLRKITSLSGWLPRWGRHATGRRLGARGDRRPQPSSKGLSLGVHVRSPQPEEHWCGEAAKCGRRPAGPSALIKSPQVTAHFRKDPPKAVLPGMRPRVQSVELSLRNKGATWDHAAAVATDTSSEGEARLDLGFTSGMCP